MLFYMSLLEAETLPVKKPTVFHEQLLSGYCLLSYFSALMLLVGQQEGHFDYKSSATTVAHTLLSETGLT